MPDSVPTMFCLPEPADHDLMHGRSLSSTAVLRARTHWPQADRASIAHHGLVRPLGQSVAEVAVQMLQLICRPHRW